MSVKNNREGRAATAAETLKIAEQGGYTAPVSRAWIELGDAQRAAESRTEFIPADGFRPLEAAYQQQRAEAPRLETRFEVINETSLQGCRALLERGAGEVLCLNFASARNPGGGFLGGSQAQEESLARSSGLYPCQLRHMNFYENHRRSTSLLYSDAMLHSPRVPVFRDDTTDALLETAYFVSFITSPAPNAGAHRGSAKSVEEAFRQRLHKLLTICYVRGYRRLVLGAWGCGVFRNEPTQVAGFFAEALLAGGQFEGAFEEVRFSVLDSSKSRQFIAPFERHFA